MNIFLRSDVNLKKKVYKLQYFQTQIKRVSKNTII